MYPTFLLLPFLILCQQERAPDNIYFVFEHFRHGARSPNRFRYKEKEIDFINVTWHEGAGELTTLGILQHYIIGRRNRERYNNLISQEFNPQEILIYSTNLNRTKTSGYAQLLGLYYENYNIDASDAKNLIKLDSDYNPGFDNLKTYPIPYFIFQEVKRGNVIKYEKTFDYDRDINCPKVKTLRDKNKRLDHHYINYYISFEKYTRKFLEDAYKFNFTIDKFEQLHRFCDAYIADKTHERLDEYFIRNRNVTETYLRCLEYEKLKLFNIEQGGQANYTGEMSMSAVMLRMINWMECRINLNNITQIKKGCPKFVLYSAHDTTLASMGRFILSAFNKLIPYPSFASTQSFELRKYNNVFYVEIYFNDTLELNFTFNDFKKKVRKVAWNENFVIDYCEVYKSEEYYILIFGFLSICVFVFILMFALLFWKYDPKGEYKLIVDYNENNGTINDNTNDKKENAIVNEDIEKKSTEW